MMGRNVEPCDHESKDKQHTEHYYNDDEYTVIFPERFLLLECAFERRHHRITLEANDGLSVAVQVQGRHRINQCHHDIENAEYRSKECGHPRL